MEPFDVLRGKAVPMLRPNINTDDIISAQAMAGKVENIGEKLFTGWRYDLNGDKRPDFILNTPRYDGAKILLGGVNFGCGSSREAAVWALYDYGIRCVIAPGFGDIFRDNAWQNGLLTIVADEETIARIAAAVEAANDPEMAVDLVRNVIVPPIRDPIPFEIDAERRQALLAGMDELDVLLARLPELDTFVAADRPARPWAWPAL